MEILVKCKHDKMVVIKFDCGSVAKIDFEDLKLFAEHSWYPSSGKGQSKYLKANVIVKGKHTTTAFHRELLKKIEGKEIDHINRDGLDNRKTNLRYVSHKENMNNQPKKRNANSKFHGINFDKTRNKYVAWVRHKNEDKSKNIGRFEKEEDAANFRELFLEQNKNEFKGQRNFL